MKQIFLIVVLVLISFNAFCTDLYQFVYPTSLALEKLLSNVLSKDNSSLVSGAVIVQRGGNELPVRAQRIYLLQSGKRVAGGATGLDGRFGFYGDFKKGDYLIEVESQLFLCDKFAISKPAQSSAVKIKCKKR